MKIDKAIKIASKELNRSEIKSSLLDAEILLSKVINKDRKFIILNSDKEIDNQEYEYFKKLIKERLSGKPIAYLTGKKFFWKYEFDISEHVLIPRPDTETIIELVLKFFKYKN